MADPGPIHSDPTHSGPANAKLAQLAGVRVGQAGTRLTTDQGVPVDDTDNSLRVGARGPSLLADFQLREKLTRFDHERIPERVVHARGSGAHGYFQAYESLDRYTRARFLCEPGRRTPVFVRFSTVQGPRGSADTVRDVRGFATKFYTDEGNFDLVANNMPVFFVQDGIKFPDFVHAVKPEAPNEMPTGASAHDTLWDFVSLQPETMHQIIWLMSDRAIPRSYRTMQGFGIHTFRLVNAQGAATFVKFHWTPLLGTHSLVWEEAQKIAGHDPDFNRRDLWDCIEAGMFPQYELGVQLVPQSDEFRFDFDLLDPTKIIPEELVPVTPIGRMVLDRNPDNFFAETEQVAFCVANVVPGIDFTDDPLLQARLFSYQDTQLTRLGGPNFAQIPINRPVVPVHNHQQDGFHQHDIVPGAGNYHPNSLGGGCPAVPGASGFTHYPQRVDGPVLRRRADTFADHYSQPTLFWNSQTDWEKQHIITAYRFELGKVTQPHIRQRVVAHLNHIDHELAAAVAEGLGLDVPPKVTDNHGQHSAALSLTARPGERLTGRKVAILAAPGVEANSLAAVHRELTEAQVVVEILAPTDGSIEPADDGPAEPATRAMNTMSSVLYDAVVVAGGQRSVATLATDGFAVHFVAEAYRHGKPIGALGAGLDLLRRAGLPDPADPAGTTDPARTVTAGTTDPARTGVIVADRPAEAIDEFITAFVAALGGQRYFDRPLNAVPA